MYAVCFENLDYCLQSVFVEYYSHTTSNIFDFSWVYNKKKFIFQLLFKLSVEN